MAETEGVGGTADLVVMDDVSGAIITMAVARGARSSLERVLVFLPDGVTLWFNRDYGAQRHRPELGWTANGRAQHVRVSAHTAEDREPAEHLATVDGPPFRVPLTLDLSLEPHSVPVPRQRPFADGGLHGSQVYRAVGAVAAGSVVYRIGGQAWTGSTGFASRHNGGGTRLQGAFQDGSALLATAPTGRGVPGPAALQQHTQTMPLTVSDFRVDGPPRRIPMRMICQLDGDPGVTVHGGYRSLDQHLAFVHPNGAAGPSQSGQGLVRRAYTPFDFARSGVTGFGILEQVERVSSPDAPAEVGTGIPETF